ncbi:ABC transporter permease [Gracilibacillus phocaeensis]|uniref:ABC transporter permease n=1 Tax=Gracilibacillus phocaeensis TaxID=2042304 RepID=UPI0010306937|nr:ABC transporter permease [Gracilibacillus phocaeensis]
MKSVITVIQEQIQYFYLVRRLSLYELKSKNKNNYLGMLWEILTPSIQILIYWFVFGTLLRRDPITIGGEVVPFVFWLMPAFFLWTFFYQSMIQGSKSIYSRLKMLSKMNFPMSVIPSYVIFSQLYVHFVMLAITIVIFQFGGYYANIYYLQIFYFLFATIALVFAISLVTSTLSTIIRDVHMLLNSILRMFLYLSGVLWPISKLADFPTIMNIMKLNPLYYLMSGYRASIFGSEWYIVTQWQYTLWFWAIVLILLIIGSTIHVRFRRHFIDYL